MTSNNVPCPHSLQGRCRSASWAVSSCWQRCPAVPRRPRWPGAPPRAGFGAEPGSSVVEVSWPVSRGTQGAGGSKGPSYLACPEPQLCPCRRGAGCAKGGQSCRGPDRLGAGGQAVLGPDLCHSPGAGENGPCEVGCPLGCRVEGCPGRGWCCTLPSTWPPHVGPRAGDRGALAGLAAAVWCGLPAAGGLPGQCLSPALPQPGATGAALRRGAHWPLASDLVGPWRHQS